MPWLLCGLLFLATTAGGAAPEPAPKKPPLQVEEHEIELDWDPTISMKNLVRGMPRLPPTTVTVRRFRDLRPRTELVADVMESPERVHVFLTEDSVGEWVTHNFARSLGQAGVRVTSGGEVVISGEIITFLASKSPDYNGDVAIRISVERGGKVQWRGTVSGWAHEPDGSGIGDEDDYNEVLSDAIMRAAASLAWYPKFRASLLGQTAEEPVVPPAPEPVD
ncbi:MAG TPA: hypothetical protein VNJ47_02375 [Nevskiales bacterium]|nr:hypothetical protein [Nevskiales bacterium]